MRRSSFTPAQIAEALTFAREEWPDATADEHAKAAASFLDFVCNPDSHADAETQVIEWLEKLGGSDG